MSSPIGTMWCLCDPTPSGWERTRLCLFQFSLRDQASNWLERLPAGSISTWEDLTTRFLAQFFPPERTTKLHNDILMFQQHQVQIFYDHVNLAIRRTINHSVDGVPSTSDRRLIELEDQVQRLMKAHLAPKSSVQVSKIASSCNICSGPHDTQYCMENPEQSFIDYASSRCNEVGERRLSGRGTQLKQQQDDVINKVNILWRVVSKKFDNTLAHDTVGNSMAHLNAISIDNLEKEAPRSKGIKSQSKLLSLKYQSQSSLGEQNRSSSTPKRVYFINTITVIRKEDESREAGTIRFNAAEDIGRDTFIEEVNEVEMESEESKKEIEKKLKRKRRTTQNTSTPSPP
ncbi:MAK10-like protein [Tanacetum coccineum]